MMSLLVGLVVLVIVVQVLRWFANVEAKTARKAINWGVVALIALVIVFLAATGRLSAALAGLFALGAWGLRMLSFVHTGRQFASMFRSFRFSSGFGNAAAAGPQASEVESAYLRMYLDHDSGAMDGEVKQGRFQGRRLKGLDLTALLAFLQEVSADPDSVGLVEAYLDRTHPDWRQTAGSGESSAANPPSSSTMTAEEAYRILGLEAGAGNDDIKAAYRRLMGQLHPDHGGSDYLAAKVNQAKDFLLKH